ncbi:hypothetical protein ACHAAC_10900 [Aeromicrobium sp. CF4.19]|uniref:hypothetical protein n=1 Tax=Aeromicrobium sp. CF4.19 TaxID=3373082 RepID=UPI003EE44C3E
MSQPPPPQGGQFGWGPPDPSAPWGRDPFGVPYSEKAKTTAGLLQLLLTLLCSLGGVGRLYAGHTAIGLTQLLGMLIAIPFMFVLIGIPVFVGLWLWSLIDGILMLTGRPLDARGLPLRP